jgi:alanine racemase
MMTHFACADQRHHPLNGTQVDRFAWAVECAAAADLPMTWVSARNSAAVLNGLRVPFVTHDRVGLAAYGLDPRDATGDEAALEPVLTLSGPVLATKVLRAGESASYGARWVAQRDMRVALIGGGYGDGIPRVDGLVVVAERSTHEVLGPVNMDQMIVADPGGRLHRGDTVRVVGGAAGDPASLPEIARRSGRSLYELCTSIGGAARTHRVVRQ